MASGQVENVQLDRELYTGTPKQLVIARQELGQTEYQPNDHSLPNIRVSGYFEACGADPDPLGTPWCAYFVGYCLVKAGYSCTHSGMARSYLKYGNPVTDKSDIELSNCKPGDIVINWRGSNNDGVTGHIFFYLKHDDNYIYGIGGNQGDAVTEAKFAINKMLAIRRPKVVAASRTIRAGVGSAGTGATGQGLDTVANSAQKPPVPDVGAAAASAAEQARPLLETMAPYLKVAAVALGIISVGLALYVVYRRYQDFYDRGA